MQERSLGEVLRGIETELRSLAAAARVAADLADTPTPPAPPPTVSDVQWLDSRTAAAKLGINTYQLRRMVKEGNLPAYKLPGGRLYRFRADELDAAMQEAAR